MTHSIQVLATVAALSLSSTLASATIWNLSTSLSGLQEVPPNASSAFGSATLTLDDVTGAVTLIGSYSGLSTPSSAAHIHGLAAVGVNAGVIFGLTHSSATSGALSGAGVLTLAQITGMLNGLTYVNVHNSAFPGGEIRGQINVVPEPGSLALLGLGAIAFFARRKS